MSAAGFEPARLHLSLLTLIGCNLKVCVFTFRHALKIKCQSHAYLTTGVAECPLSGTLSVLSID